MMQVNATGAVQQGDTAKHRKPPAPRVRVAEVEFDCVTMNEALDRVVGMTKLRNRARYVCTGNLDHLYLIAGDSEFADIYRRADLVIADGAPVVWLSRLLGSETPLPERVAGSDLFWELVRASADNGVRLFFLGGVQGAASEAAKVAMQRHPRARIVGTYCPPFETFETVEEQTRIRDVVRNAKPDVLLVAFGAPKQEKWIVRNKDALGVPVSIGVGGTFEMAAGIKKRAPKWVQHIGMEWFYRFGQEPRRLFDRYFMKDLPLLIELAARTAVARLRAP